MKRLFVYFLGSLACLGAGAAFYISVVNVAPRAVPKIVPAQTGIQSQINSALDILGDKLNKGDKPQEAVVPTTTGSVLFLGDMMLGRSVAVQMSQNGNEYPFAKIKDVVAAASFSIANLEGPMTKINNDPQNRMRFHFDPALAPVLSATGFDAFSLANNHGLDQGAKGDKDTEANLTAAGFKYFGDVGSDNGPVLRFETNGKKFSVIGLHDVYRRIDPNEVAKIIAAEKKASDIVIVYPHWGDEYQHKANARQTMLAHAFIDAGADLVIGGHPHVIQGAEMYKGKPIFYSLGNLIFDQYFSVDTQQGVALRLNVGSSGVTSIDLLPYEIPQSQPSFVDGDKKAKMLGQIAAWSVPELKDGIEAGNIKLGE